MAGVREKSYLQRVTQVLWLTTSGPQTEPDVGTTSNLCLLRTGMLDARQRPDNLLLTSLPSAERQRLEPFLKFVELPTGHEITTPGEPIQALYFPVNAVNSSVHETRDGSVIETGLIGAEGVAGVQLWLRQ